MLKHYTKFVLNRYPEEVPGVAPAFVWGKVMMGEDSMTGWFIGTDSYDLNRTERIMDPPPMVMVQPPRPRESWEPETVRYRILNAWDKYDPHTISLTYYSPVKNKWLRIPVEISDERPTVAEEGASTDPVTLRW